MKFGLIYAISSALLIFFVSGSWTINDLKNKFQDILFTYTRTVMSINLLTFEAPFGCHEGKNQHTILALFSTTEILSLSLSKRS